MKPNDLEDRLVGFAVRAGKVVDALPDSRSSFSTTESLWTKSAGLSAARASA
jgi:hypothetical protein